MKKKYSIVLIVFIFFSALGTERVWSAPAEKKEDRINQIIEINKHFQDDEYGFDEEDIKNMGYGINPAEKKQDLAKKYESLAIELETEKQEAQERFQERQEKLFMLEAKKYGSYDKLYTEHMIWDESRNFHEIYQRDQKNLQFMASMINSAYLMKEIGPATSVYFGQKGLGSFGDIDIDFIKLNSTTYDVGAKLINKGELFNVTAGAYSSTLDTNVSGGAAIATNPFSLPKVNGSFVLGGGLYGNTFSDVNKNTGGFFGQYKVDRLKLRGEVSQSQYSNADYIHTGVAFAPELQLTQSLAIKTRFLRNVSQNTDLDEVGLVYKPAKNNPRDFELEFNAGNTYTDSELSKQRFKFSAKFKI